jgi:hypothetical protein
MASIGNNNIKPVPPNFIRCDWCDKKITWLGTADEYFTVYCKNETVCRDLKTRKKYIK